MTPRGALTITPTAHLRQRARRDPHANRLADTPRPRAPELRRSALPAPPAHPVLYHGVHLMAAGPGGLWQPVSAEPGRANPALCRAGKLSGAGYRPWFSGRAHQHPGLRGGDRAPQRRSGPHPGAAAQPRVSRPWAGPAGVLLSGHAAHGQRRHHFSVHVHARLWAAECIPVVLWDHQPELAGHAQPGPAGPDAPGPLEADRLLHDLLSGRPAGLAARYL